MTRVLITARALDRHAERLAAAGERCEWITVADDGQLARGADPQVAWQSSDLHGTPAMRDFLRIAMDAPSLQWLQTYVAGIQTPFFKSLLDRGVRLTSSGASAVPMAEFVMRAVLDHYQRPDLWHQAQADRRWHPRVFREIDAGTWLVIGLGPVGRAVATRARAFGARVTGVRRSPAGDEPVDEIITPDRLHEAVRRADVVVLAAPANPSTAGMVDTAFLDRMKDRSLLVNVGRGSLVDEEALVKALERGVPEAAILDVFQTEPLPHDSPLWNHPRVVVTPHASAYGRGSFHREAASFAANLLRYLDGEPLAGEIAEIELP